MLRNVTKWTRWAVHLLILYLLFQLLWPLFFDEIQWPSWTGYLKLASLVILTFLAAYHLTSTLLLRWAELRSMPMEKKSIWSKITRACAPRLPVDPVVLTSVVLIVPSLLIIAVIASNLPSDFLSTLSTLTAILPLLVLMFTLRVRQLGQKKRRLLAVLWFAFLLLFVGFGGLMLTNWLDLGLQDNAAVRWIYYFDAGAVLMQQRMTAAMALFLLGLMAY